ncbi:MAG: hypothetical protein Q8K78_15665, partial [Planctomycetaceae bacterium]|nr:hypothetical protein [Planctomycetaceae bacterium]
VTEAFHLLAAAGNKRIPWYSRHETEIAFGGGLCGASASVNDFICGLYPKDTPWREAIIAAVMTLMIGCGVFLMVHGCVRVRRLILWTWGPCWPTKAPSKPSKPISDSPQP